MEGYVVFLDFEDQCWVGDVFVQVVEQYVVQVVIEDYVVGDLEDQVGKVFFGLGWVEVFYLV